MTLIIYWRLWSIAYTWLRFHFPHLVWWANGNHIDYHPINLTVMCYLVHYAFQQVKWFDWFDSQYIPLSKILYQSHFTCHNFFFHLVQLRWTNIQVKMFEYACLLWLIKILHWIFDRMARPIYLKNSPVSSYSINKSNKNTFGVSNMAVYSLTHWVLATEQRWFVLHKSVQNPLDLPTDTVCI